MAAPHERSVATPAPRPWRECVGYEALNPAPWPVRDAEAVVWFDVDNTLYSHLATRIGDHMQDRIRAYFQSLGLSNDEAEHLHQHYYKEYGLAIRGLVMHHAIDPLDYDRKCDASLPLEKLLHPDDALVALLRAIDRRRFRVFALTNAYKTHARRVLKLLHIEEFFDGVVFCDYTIPNFSCKPEHEFYHAADQAIGVRGGMRQYFVDDSLANVRAASAFGWSACVHYDENSALEHPAKEDGVTTISSVAQLRDVWPELFS
ncbi:suppressor of deletion of TFIIS [Malassezia sp. CBS 17886]|nr:suppressor of deletion of TFIIS [Malassezia sp. CBS 17886]